MDNSIGFCLLPELLKAILIKAVLVQLYSEDTVKRQRDKSIFINLASVAFLWWSSLKTSHFIYKIRSLTKVYFHRAKMRMTIIRNNRNFLKEVIDPDKIIFSSESCGCFTEDQVTFLTVLRNEKEKNHELLFMLQDFSIQKYSKFIDFLFATNQTSAALVLERGGEAMKVHIYNGKATRTKQLEMEFIERFERIQTENTLMFDDLLNSSVDQRMNDIFLLHAKQNKGIELWFWCKTESSLNQLKSLSYDVLREIIHQMYKTLIPEHSATLEPQFIQIDDTLASDFGERRLSIRHVGDHDNLTGFAVFGNIRYSKCVTSLADKIYVVQMTEILVFENKYPYHSPEPIVLDHEGLPVSIASCNINKCLYISFSKSHIFKVEPERDNRVSQWLSDIGLLSMSVTSKGDLLALQTKRKHMLLIFTPEGTVKRTISMEYRLGQIKFVQEIIPDIVALSYSVSSIAIMRLDEYGTILRNIEWHAEIDDLTSFRYGDILVGVSRYKLAARRRYSSDFVYVNFDNGIVQLHQSPFDSKEARNLLTTDDRIDFIHVAADRRQLYVLFENKLQIYELKYEDEDCCPWPNSLDINLN